MYDTLKHFGAFCSCRTRVWSSVVYIMTSLSARLGSFLNQRCMASRRVSSWRETREHDTSFVHGC